MYEILSNWEGQEELEGKSEERERDGKNVRTGRNVDLAKIVVGKLGKKDVRSVYLSV